LPGLCVYDCVYSIPPPSDIYTLSLHDALPISNHLLLVVGTRRASETSSRTRTNLWRRRAAPSQVRYQAALHPVSLSTRAASRRRSEEHTSELQSRENLVCRLLLEKKKHTNLFT